MKVTRRTLLTGGAMALAATALLSGCAGGGSDDSGGGDDASGLVIWADAQRIDALKPVAAEFEKEKGVSVKLVQKDFADIPNDFITQVPTGKGPDIIVSPHDRLGAFVQNGVVAPLELGDKAAEFQEVAVQAFSYEGQTYGLPYAIENIALLRNTDLAPNAPATLDDAIAAGEAAVAAGAEFPFLLGLDPVNGDPYHTYPFQTSLGAPVFGTNADGSYNAADLAMKGAGGVQFATLLQSLGQRGVLNENINGDIAKEKFLAGASPFYMTGPWNLPDIKEAGLNYSIDPIPTTGSAVASPFVGVNGFVISAKSKNPVAATEFVVNYTSTEDVQTALFEVGGRAPALTTAFEAAGSDPDIAAFGEVGATGVPMPSIPAMGAVWEDWGQTQMALVKGEGDPATLWAAMSTKIEEKVAAG